MSSVVSVSGLAAEAGQGRTPEQRMIAVERRRLDRLTNPRRPPARHGEYGGPKSLLRLQGPRRTGSTGRPECSVGGA